MRPHPPIRALIYDCGNTLLRPRGTFEEICELIASEHGHRLDPKEFQESLPHWRGWYHGVKDMYAKDEHVREGWAAYYAGTIGMMLGMQPSDVHHVGRSIYDWYTSAAQWEPYDDVLTTLAEGKRRGFVQGVLSDWGSDLLPILAELDMTRYFDFVVVSAVVGFAKPTGDIFQHAMSRAGVTPAEALYIGDSYVADVLGARAAGLQAALIDREGEAPEVDCPVLRRLADVFELVGSPAGASS